MRAVFTRWQGRRQVYPDAVPEPTSTAPQDAMDTDPYLAEQQRLNRAEFWAREELIALLSVAGTLAGLSVTVVAFMNDKSRSRVLAATTEAAGAAGRHHAHMAPATTVVDDLFSLCALLFLVCVYLIFIALRTRHARSFRWLVRLVDLAFVAGLTMMTAAGFVLVYTVW